MDKTISLEHSFIHRSHDIVGLLKSVNKLSTFCSNLEKQSLLFPDRYDPDKYKGDGFELLVEALIKLSPVDNRIGIVDYKVITDIDTGVDGFGTGMDGKPATVQVKYRSNNAYTLTANDDHLTNFTNTSMLRYGVDSNTTTNLLIVTTAEGLHYFTDNEMFLKKVRCIGYGQLRKLLDNNIHFWNCFRELLSIENK